MIGTDSYIVPRWSPCPSSSATSSAPGSSPSLYPIAQQLAWRNAARLMGTGDTPFRGD
ncbi:MAG: hypothetical protein U0841_30675 [Chloroflexia bacterium]